MAINDSKPLFTQPANAAIPFAGSHATSMEKNPFLSFYHHIGQFIENHYKWGFVKAHQTIQILKSDMPGSDVTDALEDALEDVLASGGILAVKAAEGAAIYGQNVTSNPAAHQALEDFMVAFGKFSQVIASHEGPSAPSPLPPPSVEITPADLGIHFVGAASTEDGSSSTKYAEGSTWTETGDGTQYPVTGQSATAIGGFAPKVPKPADESTPVSTEPPASN